MKSMDDDDERGVFVWWRERWREGSDCQVRNSSPQNIILIPMLEKVHLPAEKDLLVREAKLKLAILQFQSNTDSFVICGTFYTRDLLWRTICL